MTDYHLVVQSDITQYMCPFIVLPPQFSPSFVLFSPPPQDCFILLISREQMWCKQGCKRCVNDDRNWQTNLHHEAIGSLLWLNMVLLCNLVLKLNHACNLWYNKMEIVLDLHFVCNLLHCIWYLLTSTGKWPAGATVMWQIPHIGHVLKDWG